MTMGMNVPRSPTAPDSSEESEVLSLIELRKRWKWRRWLWRRGVVLAVVVDISFWVVLLEEDEVSMDFGICR